MIPELIRAAQRVVSGLCWSGALELELMRHRDSGELYLIEINPRFPAWIQLAATAGQNLPWRWCAWRWAKPCQPLRATAPACCSFGDRSMCPPSYRSMRPWCSAARLSWSRPRPASRCNRAGGAVAAGRIAVGHDR